MKKQRTIKIAFIGAKGVPALFGGVERHVEELACGLTRIKGCEVYVYARPHYTPKRLKKYKGVNIINLPSLVTKNLDAITHTFLSTLHAIFVLRPDVIHFHAIGPALCLWIPKLLAPKTKIVFTFHCKDYFHKKWSVVAQAMLKLGEKIGCRWADEVIAVSDELRQYVEEYYDRKCYYIPHGVEKFKNISAKMIKAKWGLKKNGYILTVNRLIRHKGIHYLIKAYGKLKTDKKLVITGPAFFTDDYEREIKEMAKSNPNIIFTGSQKGRALWELFSNAYVFVNPSDHEGFPMAVMEAGSFGRPLILSDIRCHKDMFENLPVFFATRDANDLTRRLRNALSSPMKFSRQGKKLQKFCRRSYDWKKIIRQTALLYS